MIRVIYASPTNTDTPSFYRGWGPLCQLLKTMPEMALGKTNQFDWATIRQADVFCFTRNYTEGCVRAVEMCRAQGKFVWVDYDDSFLHVPESNPNYESLKDSRENVIEIAKLANVITVSTQALREDFSFVRHKVFVVPNAYDNDFLGDMTIDPTKRDKVVIWRGSATHDEDLAPITSELVNYINSEAFVGWKIYFMGHNPAYITSQIKDTQRVQVVPPKDIVQYFANIKALNPAMFIVPLKDTAFNRCKSNIAWIEATYAGAMTIASNLPEFRRPGVLIAEEAHFVNTLAWNVKRANDNDTHVAEHWKFSRDAIYGENKLLLTEVNNARKQIILNGAKISRGEMGRLS